MKKFSFKNISSAFRKDPTIKMVQPSVVDKVKITEQDDESSYFQRLDFAFIYRPVYFASRVFGLMPFSINYDSNGVVQGPKVRIFDIVWFITSICLYMCFIHQTIQTITSFKSPDSSIYLIWIGNEILLMFGLVFGVITICTDMFNRYRIVDIVKSFNTFDNEVHLRIIFAYLNTLTFHLSLELGISIWNWF